MPPLIRPSYNPIPALHRLKSLLRQTLRVFAQDGRIFIGMFVGTDAKLNILLVNTEEYRFDAGSDHPEGRFVGQVMIPWRLVVKAEAQRAHDERPQDGQYI